MAARGSLAKEVLKKAILEKIEGSFENGKEIRVPIEENGEIVEIKLTMTAAKDNIMGVSKPQGESKVDVKMSRVDEVPPWEEPTEEEKENLEKLIDSLF